MWVWLVLMRFISQQKLLANIQMREQSKMLEQAFARQLSQVGQPATPEILEKALNAIMPVSVTIATIPPPIIVVTLPIGDACLVIVPLSLSLLIRQVVMLASLLRRAPPVPPHSPACYRTLREAAVGRGTVPIHSHCLI